MDPRSQSQPRGGGVADYFAIVGVGDKLTWKHAQKKSGVELEEKHTEEENEALLIERFYREIVEAVVVATSTSREFDSRSSVCVPQTQQSFSDDVTLNGSIGSDALSKLSSIKLLSSATSVAGFARTAPTESTAQWREFEGRGFTIVQSTCPAGRSSKHQDQASVSSNSVNDSLSGTPVTNESFAWTKSQIFRANLDPFEGFRRDIISTSTVQEPENTLKDIGRKVSSTLRHQLGPLLPLRSDRRSGKSFAFHLAYRRRAPDEKDLPAIADLDLMYVRIHRETAMSTHTWNEGSTDLKSALKCSVTTDVRGAETSKQKLLDSYWERHERSTRTHPQHFNSLEGSNKLVIALEDLLKVPQGFDEWSIPNDFRWIQLPGRSKEYIVGEAGFVTEGRAIKANIGPHFGGVVGVETVTSDDNVTQFSDPSGSGFEAHFDGSVFVFTPPSSTTGVSDLPASKPESVPSPAGRTSVLIAEHDDRELATSFEVVDPATFVPHLLRCDDLPDLSNPTISQAFLYVPIIAVRRQRVRNEERYHEDPALVDLTVSFRDFDGTPVLPSQEEHDEDVEDDDIGFNLLGNTQWSITPMSENSNTSEEITRVTSGRQVLGLPVILARKNHPLGFADATFATRVLDRFPLKNYKGVPLPEEELPMFCYPTGCRLHRARYNECPLPQYFGFVLKNERGDSIYVSCVSFMEPLSTAKEEQLKVMSWRRRRVSIPHRRFCSQRDQQKAEEVAFEEKAKITETGDEDHLLTGFDEMTTFENKTICLISRYPFWTAFRRFLSHLHILAGSPSDLPVERWISHLLLNVPLPKAGGPCVLVPLPALNCPMVLCTPAIKDLPLLDLPFQRLFACLDVPTIVTIVIGLLSLEKKMIIVSSRPSLVLDVCELLKALLFPFDLCAPYVPRLTEPFMSCLDFPGAIFVGIHDDGTVDGLAAKVRGSLPEDSTIVDLDTGEVDSTGDRYKVLKQLWTLIPAGPRSMLVSELETLCRDAGIVPGQEPLDSEMDCAFDVSLARTNLVDDMNDKGHAHREPLDDRAVRDAFLRFFTAALAGYERFLVPPDLDFKTSGSEWFDTGGFLSSASQEKAPYLEQLVSTQLFQLFIQRRTEASDAHCLLFDECLVEYHSSPIPYGRLGGDVEALPSEDSRSPQMLYSLLVDQCCTESHQTRGASFDNALDGIEARSETTPVTKSPNAFLNESGDLVTPPTRDGLSPRARFVYFIDGNPCFPQHLNPDFYSPNEPDSLLVEISDIQLPMLTRSEREIEESSRRRKASTSQKRVQSHRRCLWQLPKLMGSHFLGAWLLCIPSQVSQKGISQDCQARHLLRALGAIRLLRNKQRIIPDEASYRALMVACGCVSSDRRIELAKLFGLLRSDGIFPSAVTLGQYTRALAEGYSKRPVGTQKSDNILCTAKTNTASNWKGALVHLEESVLNSLDENIGILEDSGRRWRSRLVHGREWDQNAALTADNSSQVGSLKREDDDARKRTTHRTAWQPIVVSSSFAPALEKETQTQEDLVVEERVTLVALWSKTTCCKGCSYIPLDEEIQSGWDVVHDDETDLSPRVTCPRCDFLIDPLIGFREITLKEAVDTHSRDRERQDAEQNFLPPQLQSFCDASDGDKFVSYVSPETMRIRLEKLLEEHGEAVLEREILRQVDHELFYNFWWYCSRFSMPLPLPVAPGTTVGGRRPHKHCCAFAAWDRSTALYGCTKAAEVMMNALGPIFSDNGNFAADHSGHAEVALDDAPLLSRVKLQDLSKNDWDNEDLSKILVTLVEACDKRDFRPVVECTMQCIKRRQKEHGSDLPLVSELDCYRTILYLAKYQCTTAFHVFFPAVVKPCKGYHFWCAFGTPLPIFDRLFRDAVTRIQRSKRYATPINDVSDVAIGFRCVFGHIL